MLGLGNSITGGAVSGFTPVDLGSTLLAWYQFNTGQTNLSGTDGNADNEMKWEDQSGGSRHAFQREPTLLNQPLHQVMLILRKLVIATGLV